MQQKPLTAEQRELVSGNVGLVATHLSRNVPGLGRPTRHREWEDLFQEGCLGLAAAAVQFDQHRGIPFAAFALRRIQAAVNRALHTKFSTVAIPGHERHRPGGAPVRREVSLVGEAVARADVQRGDPRTEHTGETVGDAVRAKCETAIRAAAEAVKDAETTRGDRRRLVDRVVEERLLVPSEESKTAMRRIARDSDVSYARVTRTERLLAGEARRRLREDQEFADLRAVARRSRDGLGAAMDEEAAERLSSAADRRIMQVLRAAAPAVRGLIVVSLLQAADLTVEQVARSVLSRLDVADKRRLVARYKPVPDPRQPPPRP